MTTVKSSLPVVVQKGMLVYTVYPLKSYIHYWSVAGPENSCKKASRWFWNPTVRWVFLACSWRKRACASRPRPCWAHTPPPWRSCEPKRCWGCAAPVHVKHIESTSQEQVKGGKGNVLPPTFTKKKRADQCSIISPRVALIHLVYPYRCCIYLLLIPPAYIQQKPAPWIFRDLYNHFPILFRHLNNNFSDIFPIFFRDLHK